jgi:Rho guanine nucleotide exchange factor 7
LFITLFHPQPTISPPYFAGLESEENTPTLRQLYISVRQLQQDMIQVKSQLSEERAIRGHLQQILMGHLESLGNNTKC